MDKNRKAAYKALLDIETKGAYSNIAVNNIISREKPSDEAFVRNLMYGVLENQIYIDYKLSKLVKSGLAKVRPQALILLRMGAYQLEFMGGVPAYAAINECVSIAKKKCRGLDGFINGVLRSYERLGRDIKLPDKQKDPAEYLSVMYSYSRDIADLWLDSYGFERTESLMKAGNNIPPFTIRVNRLKTSCGTLSGILAGEGYNVMNIKTGNETYDNWLKELALSVSGGAFINSEAFRSGLFSVQDISSMIAISALSPEEGDIIIDLCAAPGGKSLCAAELMNNRGRILSCDIYDHKLKLIEDTAKRLGIKIVETVKNDGIKLNKDFIGLADKVIVDAPCSGLGVVRRKPEIKLKTSMEDIKNICKIQSEILENASKYVKEKGTLIYSTCTISTYENQGIIEMFLKKNKNFFQKSEIQLFPDYDNADGFYFSVLQRF